MDTMPETIGKLRSLGGDQLARRMIELFMENSPQRMSAAREGLQSGDLERLSLAVHSLKSSAAHLGAMTLHEIAEWMEIQADAGERAAVAGRWDVLESAYSDARQKLAVELETM